MNCCPDCGSDRAVSKAAAWDALVSVPEKTKKRLDVLEKLLKTAISLTEREPDIHEVRVTVPLVELVALREILDDLDDSEEWQDIKTVDYGYVFVGRFSEYGKRITKFCVLEDTVRDLQGKSFPATEWRHVDGEESERLKTIRKTER